jgi:bla regulator protein blaR1
MKRYWMLPIIALAAALPGSAMQADNLNGTWQGTIQPPQGQGLRVVVKVEPDNGKQKATFYSIDQRSPAIPVNKVTVDGSSVKLEITAINGTYQGKLSGDVITGTWTQGGPQMPLNLARATPETAWAIPEPPPPPARMDPKADPEFTVATIKPSEPGRPGKLFTVRGADVLTINTTLSDLITMAYNIHPKQITNAPDWIESDKFDVTGRPDTPGQPSVDQMKTMIQKMLADRFQLKFHRDKKELSVYTLTAAKSGSKITKSERDPNGLPGLFFTGPTVLNVTNATMDEFANLLQGAVLDKPVVNQTGLNDKYDFVLKFTPDPTQMTGLLGGAPRPPADNPDAPPDLFTAVQQQLGLKLDSTKAPADVLVIDKVAKPSEN